MANLIHVYDPVTGQPTLLTAAQVLALVGAARTSPDFRIQLIASGVAGLAVTTSVAEAELSVSLHRRQADLTNMVAIRLLRAVTGGAIGAPVVLDGCIEAR